MRSRTATRPGAQRLADLLPGARGPCPDGVSAEIEAAVLVYCLDAPPRRASSVVQQRAPRNRTVSAIGVRGIYARRKLQTKHERLLRLERTAPGQEDRTY